LSNREASRTALATAYLRAAHQILDAQPRVLQDPVALCLLGKTASQRIRSTIERYQTPGAKALRSHIVLRSRFTEDRLCAAVRRGITQYILLGAGFDTFAFRQPQWANTLKIIEVDHPGTQTLKRSHLVDSKLEIPTNVSFANIDFEHESLLEGLLRQGISLKEPTFFSWLGVTMYLNETAIDATLLATAAFPPGSEIVTTFLEPPDSTSLAPSQLAERVSGIGEPFVSYFEPEEIETKLLNAGFTVVEFLSPEDANLRYYKGRPRDLPVPNKTGIVCALR